MYIASIQLFDEACDVQKVRYPRQSVGDDYTKEGDTSGAARYSEGSLFRTHKFRISGGSLIRK